MHKVKIKFDHPNVEGILHVKVNDADLERLENINRAGGFYLNSDTGMCFYLEIGDELTGHVTIEKQHELPTEEGVYMDCDGNIWRLRDVGGWIHLSEGRLQFTEPEHRMPFTQLKLGRTY